MRGGRADDLQQATRLKTPERGHEITIHGSEQVPQPFQARAPVLHQRQQRLIAGRGERRRSLPARRQPLLEERLQLVAEHRIGELVGENRREADRHGRCNAFALERLQLFEERQVGIDRRLAQPIATVWPAAVIQDVGKVAMQRENEVH